MRKFPFDRSFLKGQKVRKRSAKSSKKKRTIGTLLILLLTLTVGLTFFFNERVSKESPIPLNLVLTPSWDISVLSNLRQNKQKVLRIFEEKKSNFASLQSLADFLQKSFPLAQTNIIQTGPQKLKIILTERSPVLTLYAEKPRLISSSGEVYGEAGPKDIHLPSAYDLLEKSRDSYIFSEANALLISQEESERMTEALLILSLSEKFSLAPKSISFIPYRGFKLHLKGSSVEVFLGRKPFEYKFVKLLEILKQTQEANQEANTIELDYEGKAFIKTSKIGEKVDS